MAAFLALSQAVSSRHMTDLSSIWRELEKSRRKVLDGLVPSGTILREGSLWRVPEEAGGG